MINAMGTVLFFDALHTARVRMASDLHLVEGLPPVLRIDGTLQAWEGPGLSRDDLEALAERLLDADERQQLARTGDLTVTNIEGEAPIRVHASRVAASTTLTLRFLARDLPSIEALDLPSVVNDVARRACGLIILGGPTGSGKSTTLAAIVTTINRDTARKIIMIEDPVEYRLNSIRSLVLQRQVGRDVPSFAEAVRAALRSDPDVIVIGEIRDAATAQAAIVAAETGHLVLATLHTGDASQSIDRLVDAFPTERAEYVRGRIAHVLLCSISQRLVQRANGAGRRIAAEVLIVNDAVRHMIRDGKHHQLPSVMATGRRFGMQTLEAHLLDLVSCGAVTADIAEAVLR